MLEKHHIVFKSQGGLDFELNYKYLTAEEHRGDYGPHKNKGVDLKYKKELQNKLEELLTEKYYSIEKLINLLGLKDRQAYKAFRYLNTVKGVKREDALRRLMGGKIYE